MRYYLHQGPASGGSNIPVAMLRQILVLKLKQKLIELLSYAGCGIRTHSVRDNGFTVRPGSPTPAPQLVEQNLCSPYEMPECGIEPLSR